MRRPGLLVANGQPQDTAQMLSWQPGAITCYFDDLVANDIFNYKAANPDVSINVRFRHPLDWQQNPAESAKALGEFIAGQWATLQSLDPFVYVATRLNTHYANGDPNPANQRHYTTPEFYQRCGQWIHRTADIIKQAVPEIKLVTPPFAFGFNEDGAPDDQGRPLKGWAGFDYLQETVRDYFDGILTFQGYWGYPAAGSVPDWLYEPTLSSWYAFRWQRLLQLFQTRYGFDASIIIDEAGSFGPADPDFTTQLIYYAQQCLSDDRVISLSYALWANPAGDALYAPHAWVNHVPHLERHLERLRRMPALPSAGVGADPVRPAGLLTPPPPPAAPVSPPPVASDLFADPFAGSLEGILEVPFTLEEGEEFEPVVPAGSEHLIRVLFENGRVETMPLEEYLRAVVPTEMPASWPLEALKAQAIASRTYARYAMEHPRFPNADICTTTKCQGYDPTRIRDRSDQAVRETEGLVIRANGQTINALFSANCGGHTRNNDEVWPGRALPYLRGVSCPVKERRSGHGVGLCQYGARELARQGQSYDLILRHYYQSITLEQI